MINLTITPQHAARLEGHDNELYALVRAYATEDTPNTAGSPEKPPLNLSIVIDRSGSMGGQPLAEAKRAAAFLVDHLRPSDRVAIVTYADEAEVLVAGRPVGSGVEIGNAIRSIETDGSTALHDGWMAGVEQAARMREPEQMGRVLLLSDGRANRGVCNPAILAQDAARIAATGITTTTCGLGAHFDELLMLEIAMAGQGSAYYGERAEDLIDPFREELELLSNLLARRLRLSLTAGEGVDLTVLNGYRQDGVSLILPDLAEGGEAWAMVRLRFSEKADQPAERLLLRTVLDFETMNGEHLTAGPTSLRLPRLPAGAFAALLIDDTVAARRSELRAADIQDQARLAARARHWPEVDRLIADAKLEAGDNKWVAASLDSLERIARSRDVEGFSKESVFAARKMRSRLAASDEFAPSSWSANTESTRAAYLRKKPIQGRRFDRPDDENSP
jgi:Ca-activated chloride channel family protein